MPLDANAYLVIWSFNVTSECIVIFSTWQKILYKNKSKSKSIKIWFQDFVEIVYPTVHWAPWFSKG